MGHIDTDFDITMLLLDPTVLQAKYELIFGICMWQGLPLISNIHFLFYMFPTY